MEIIVMNRLGVALASDSAASVEVVDHMKVYHADKLFMLSQKNPVGIMVYNSASLLGVPWETILKMFRKQLGATTFASLEEYGDALIAYLDKNQKLFPQKTQDEFYLNLVDALYIELERKMFNDFQEMFLTASNEDQDENTLRKEIAKSSIADALSEWKDASEDSRIPTSVGETLAARLSPQIAENIKKWFSVWKLEQEETQALIELAKLVVSKDKFVSDTVTGLVIAGFGEAEHLPVMQCYELGEIFDGRLKYRKLPARKVDERTRSVVEAFADKRIVQGFLHGIDSSLAWKISEKVVYDVLALVQKIVGGIPRMSAKSRQQYLEVAIDEARKDLGSLLDNIETFKEEYVAPMHKSIEYMPKGELAQVAAFLVSLTSLHKRMSSEEQETVAGPIDVAVISKGDGFVWIQRKHYFRPELNHHFFSNYGSGPGAVEVNKRDKTSEEDPN